ncbi:hypothetical protein D3C80_1884470 [compost metagenome]
MEQFNEEGSCETHNNQSDKSTGKDDEELTAVKSTDFRKPTCRKSNREGNCCKNGVYREGDVSNFYFKDSKPKAGFLFINCSSSTAFSCFIRNWLLEQELSEDMVPCDKQ